jgi:tripartite-type tricarboxylate transporter receptor subunit TctC
VTKFEHVLGKELAVGSDGVADDTYQFPAVLNGMLGTKFKMITGYPGGNEINLAMERNEVQGRCGFPWSTVKATRRNWIDEKKIHLLMQFSLAKHPDLPSIPLVTDLAKDDEQRQVLRLIFGRHVMGRPYTAPPGIPKDRSEALRKAFMDTMADKKFLFEIDTARLEISPVSGDKIESLILDIYKTTPPAVAEKAAALVK